jgi:hypothetical protein
MRTAVHIHTHTFHPEAEEERKRLVAEERRLTRLQAREPEDGPKRSRMSEPAEDVDASLEDVRARIAEQDKVINSGRVRLVIKGLTRGEFRRLLAAHPPREGDELDKVTGYNGDTFLDEFVSSAIVSTHDLDGNEVPNEWVKWADEMTRGQWEQLLKVCLDLTNDGEPVFPR